MLAGTCEGVTGAADCVHVGWSPNWLVPQAVVDIVDGKSPLILPAFQIICPWCVLQRVDNFKVPGFNKPKLDKVKAEIVGFHCMAVGGSRSIGHTHIFQWNLSDDLSIAINDSPASGQRVWVP